MKVSLESLLRDSLNGVVQNSAPNIPEPGPLEGLTLLTSEQITADAIEYMKENRYEGVDGADITEMYLTEMQDEVDDQPRSEAELKDAIGGITASMEMLSALTSSDSFDPDAVVAAQTVVNNIHRQYEVEGQAPVLEINGDKFTEVSMEGVVDWVKGFFKAIKKWVAQKMANIVLNQRRAVVNRQTLLDRAEEARKIMSTFGDDYGIPNKQVRYSPETIFKLFARGAQIPFEKKAMTEAIDEIKAVMVFGNTQLHPDAISRSTKLGEVMGQVLIARDEMDAEQKLKGVFAEVSKPLPVTDYLTEKRLFGVELPSGQTFVDISGSYRSKYRDAAWISQLTDLIDINQSYYTVRRVGGIPNKVNDLPELQVMLEAVGSIVDDDALTNHSFYDELARAWNDANGVYNRLFSMIMSLDFPHMNNELWRAVDVGSTAMYLFLDKAYGSTCKLRSPMYRYADGLLTVIEEQLKLYKAVNR